VYDFKGQVEVESVWLCLPHDVNEVKIRYLEASWNPIELNKAFESTALALLEFSECSLLNNMSLHCSFVKWLDTQIVAMLIDSMFIQLSVVIAHLVIQYIT